jgi:hypothetical protein
MSPRAYNFLSGTIRLQPSCDCLYPIHLHYKISLQGQTMILRIGILSPLPQVSGL